MRDMDSLIEERDGVMVVSPQGSLDAQTVDEFRAQTDGSLGAGARYFVIDLGAAPLVDSTGLGALVRLYKRVRVGEGNVCLSRVPSDVKKILDLTRLSRVFEVYPTIEEAAISVKEKR